MASSGQPTLNPAPAFSARESLGATWPSDSLSADSAHVADVVTVAGRTDMIDFSVSRNAHSCKRRAAPPERNGTRATPERNGHDLDVADAAVRCCDRTEAVTTCGLFEGATRYRSRCTAAAGAALAGSASSRLSANALTVARPRMAGSTPASLSRRTRFDTATRQSWSRCVGPAERKQGRDGLEPDGFRRPRRLSRR